MSEQNQNEPKEKFLSDFKGTTREQLEQKSAFISKYGLAAFEKIVLNSSPKVQR